jgi:hypothetical protein
MAEVMEQLDAERDKLLDEDDQLLGRVKDKEEVAKRLRHKLLPRNAWRLIPFFELFMSSPKDELHKWYVHTGLNKAIHSIYLNLLGTYQYVLDY